MKKIILAIALLLLTGCERHTEYGSCVGINDPKDPTKVYRYSAWNVTLGLIFIETAIVPLVIIFDDLECPVSKNG